MPPVKLEGSFTFMPTLRKYLDGQTVQTYTTRFLFRQGRIMRNFSVELPSTDRQTGIIQLFETVDE